MRCADPEKRRVTARVLDTATAGAGERWASVPDWANRCEVFVQADAGVTASIEVRRKVEDPEEPGDASALDVRRGSAVSLSGAGTLSWGEAFSVAPGEGEITVRAASVSGGAVRALVSFWRE